MCVCVSITDRRYVWYVIKTKTESHIHLGKWCINTISIIPFGFVAVFSRWQVWLVVVLVGGRLSGWPFRFWYVTVLTANHLGHHEPLDLPVFVFLVKYRHSDFQCLVTTSDFWPHYYANYGIFRAIRFVVIRWHVGGRVLREFWRHFDYPY